ncbi:MAG TPA: haloacid dehalogenase-like hydrolase [Sandaracinaceae bacterium LLY-WYZ-13_1]|nr:haloacid dehalogenase-like hydrolase [Sandaracinaceae bacterium LLY-WYZ-13_1]
MSAREPTVLLFDVDGTLLTCGGAGRRAMEAAFRETVGRDDVCGFSFAGHTDRAIAREGLVAAGQEPDDAAIDAFLACYLRHLPDALSRAEAYAVLGGVVQLLDALEGRERVAIGLGTGNVEPGARAKLRRGALEHRFAFGGFGSDHEERPRLIAAGAARGAARLGEPVERCRVVVIGDTPRDVAAALAIGAECVAVATGGPDAEALRDAGAHAVFDALDEPGVRAALGLG